MFLCGRFTVFLRTNIHIRICFFAMDTDILLHIFLIISTSDVGIF